MFESIKELMQDYEYEDAVVLDSFASTMADGYLETYDDFVLYGLKENGNIIGYAVDHYHEGLESGCFGVREVVKNKNPRKGTENLIWNGECI